MKTKGQINVRIEIVANAEKSDLEAVQLQIDALDSEKLAAGDVMEEEECDRLRAKSVLISAKWQAYISALEWVLE